MYHRAVLPARLQAPVGPTNLFTISPSIRFLLWPDPRAILCSVLSFAVDGSEPPHLAPTSSYNLHYLIQCLDQQRFIITVAKILYSYL